MEVRSTRGDLVLTHIYNKKNQIAASG